MKHVPRDGKSRSPARVLAIGWMLCLFAGFAFGQPQDRAAGTIGVNKYDLFAQYTGTASGGDGSVAYRRVTVAMARKSLADARDAGIRYMRVSMSGRSSQAAGGRADSLYLWRTDPQAFWRQVDEMMGDLDAHGIQIIPVLAWSTGKFPVMVDEPTGEMFRNPNSKAWKLLERYTTEFITRYRSRPTVLFYELTNELNNYADLDLVKRCKRKDDECEAGQSFTTEDMVRFTGRFAALVKRLDPARSISSGFTIPRPAAEHIRARPEWVTGRPDFTPDSRQQFAKNLQEIHANVDVISIHLYAADVNKRFGSNDPADLLGEAKSAADRAGKPLFVGEFGDREAGQSKSGGHAVSMIRRIKELRIPYSAIWAWQFYQNSTFETRDNRHSIHSLEPGITDVIIDEIRRANGASGAPGLAGARVAALGRDAGLPRVVLTWPLPCASMRTIANVHATASDDGRVSKVDFLVNGKLLATDAQAPYTAALPRDALRPGKNRLTARAVDAAGNVAEFSSDVVSGSIAEKCEVEPR